MTGGSDALGDVVVQLDVDGRRVTGRGVSVDVVEASARAYLAAINRALRVAGLAGAGGSGGRGRAVTHRIGVIPGDGTGPEVVREGLKVLEAVRAVEGFDVELVEFDLGGDRYLRTGDTLPDDELARLRQMDAILLGAVGHPRREAGHPRARPAAAGAVRAGPVREPPPDRPVPRACRRSCRRHGEDDVNMVVVRENSEGLYSGAGGFHRKGTEHEVAVQESINTRHGVERIVRYAFELAMRPDRRRKLTLVHKTNVLTFAGDLYQRVVNEVAAEFPDVETDYVHVDACCIYFLDQPARFDVIVTDNMFGDIITDLGAMIQGGMGIAAGGNINPAGVEHVRADRRHRARPRGEGARSTRSPRSVRSRCCCAQLGEDGAAARVVRGHPVRVHEDGVDARRRDGLSPPGGRRPRGGAGDGMTTPTPGARRKVELYDTTLRDGAQGTGLSYSIEDRLRILHKIDQLGVPFIEGGWPGANPRDTEFFRLATKETLQHAALTSFGMTRKAGERAEDSAVLRELLDTGTEVVCIVGKASDVHVTEVLRTDLDEGVAMVRDSVAFLRAQGRRVFFDAEHFFDGYRSDPDVRDARARGGAGGGRRAAGAVRHERRDAAGGHRADRRDEVARRGVRRRVGHPRAQRRRLRGRQLADRGRARRVPGAGRRERLRRAHRQRRPDPDRGEPRAEDGRRLPARRRRVERLTEVAHFVAEVANLAPDSRQPYAGRYAFTHKAGLHASGVARLEEAYEHVRPGSVGNRRGIVASDLGGAATLRMKAEEFGVELARAGDRTRS